MNFSSEEIICLIKQVAIENNGKTPTIKSFAAKLNLHPTSIIRQFGSWNKLLKKAGLTINKSNKRSNEQLLGWLKSHPNTRYHDIPFGIRNKLEQTYKSIRNARKIAGLSVLDWRSCTKNRIYNKPINAGRPIEYTKEDIVKQLQSLAVKLGRPPRSTDITKKNCGFTKGAVLCKFDNLNAALQAACLPIIYSHQEHNKLIKELEILMVNIKITLNDIPMFFKFEQNDITPTFTYIDHCELVFLKRSEIFSNIDVLLKHKEVFNNVNVWFLVDDSLDDDKRFSINCVMDLIEKLQNKKQLADYITTLRHKYDEISRKYIEVSYVIN